MTDEMERLSWRDKFVRQLVQTLEGYNSEACEVSTPQVISGPENYVILKVSLDEWTMLYSSLYTGADICYPTKSDTVRWILNRAVECPVSICDLIIDCITNNPATLQAIIDGLAGSDEFNDRLSEVVRGLTETQIVSPLIAGSCDNAVLAGKMLTLVDRLDTNNKDALEIVEVGTNDEEKIAAFLEGIPIADELPIGDAIDFMQDFLEDFEENYSGASTIDRRENLARDLYCLAKSKVDCELTFGDLFEFFQARVSSGLTLESLIQNVADWVITGDFSTDDLVFDGMYALQIAAIRTGQEFFGIDAPRIAALTRDADPSSIWEEWAACSDDDLCEGAEGSVDFRASDGAFIETYDRAEYYETSPRGWGIHATLSNRISIRRALAPQPVRMRFNTLGDPGEIRVYNWTTVQGSILGSTTTYVTNPDGSRTYTIASMTAPTSSILIDIGVGSLADNFRLRWICWNYDV